MRWELCAGRSHLRCRRAWAGGAAATGVVLALTGAAAGQTDESLLLKPWEGSRIIEAEAQTIWMPRSAPAGSVGLSTLIDTTSDGRVRLSTEHELNPTIGYEFTRLQVRDREGRVPNGLIDVSGAVASPLFTFGPTDAWFLGARAGVGYAGDEAFGNSDAWYGKGSVSVGRELAKDEDIIFWLDYDGNRTFFPDIPLPHIAYVREVSEQFSFVLGLPDSALSWKPTRGLYVEVNWQAPFSFDATVTQSLGGGLKVFAGYHDVTEAFHLESLRSEDRLFYNANRLEAGVRYDLSVGWSIDAGVGYGFGQSLKTGFSQFGWETLAHLPDRPYLRFGATLAF